VPFGLSLIVWISRSGPGHGTYGTEGDTLVSTQPGGQLSGVLRTCAHGSGTRNVDPLLKWMRKPISAQAGLFRLV
jgi:hypothetical protein